MEGRQPRADKPAPPGSRPYRPVQQGRGSRLHASRNLATKILEWEYGIEIERTRLRLHPEEQRPASSSDTVSAHEGTCPQGAGVSHGQAVLSASLASGGDRHV